MNLEWLLPVWSETEGAFLIKGANNVTPDVTICGGGVTPTVLERFAEQLTLAFAYIAQHGDFHRAALAYTKEQSKLGDVQVKDLTPMDPSQEGLLRAEIARLHELVGFYERSNTARLLGISDTQLAAVRDVLGHIKRSCGPDLRGGVRTSVAQTAVDRWEREGFPLAPP